MSPKRTSKSSSDVLACPRRYDLDERFCAHCGMPLVYAGGAPVEPLSDAHERARKIRPELTRGELRRVAWARNQAEAELIQNLLLEEGVPSMVRRSAGFDVPDFLAAGPRDILVPESGVEVARTALQTADIEPSPRRPPTPSSSSSTGSWGPPRARRCRPRAGWRRSSTATRCR